MSESTLSIYLNDHLGMITAEIELAKRVARENKGVALERFANLYVDEVKRQRDLITETLELIGSGISTLKQTAGWLAEKLGRLKPNDALMSYTDLARVLELEALVLAAQARLLMWDALAALTHSPMLPTTLYLQAKESTSHQIVSLQQQHQEAVHVVFKSSAR